VPVDPRPSSRPGDQADVAVGVVVGAVGLGEAADAYEHFDRRDDGWTRVILKPGRTVADPRSG
jgi:hypothetical protein